MSAGTDANPPMTCFYHFGEDEIKGWKPENIWHAVVGFETDGQDIRFRLLKKDKILRTDIGNYINEIRKGTEIAALVGTPLDLSDVDEDCYIVFEFHMQRNWQYCPDKQCVTLKDKDVSRYSSLRHVDPGKEGNDLARAPENCRIVYFSMKPPEKGAKADSINLHIEFTRQDKSTGNTDMTLPMIVDPDIRHT